MSLYQATPGIECSLYEEIYCELCDGLLEAGDHQHWCNGDGTVRWRILRDYVLERDHFTCCYCGDQEGPFHVDHVKPRRWRGRDAHWNLVAACAPCNLSKSAWIAPWLKKFEEDRARFEAARVEAFLLDSLEAA